MRILAIIAALFTCLSVSAQVTFYTEVRSTVYAREPFIVQYIIEDVETVDEFMTPDFKGFTLISGPKKSQGTAVGNNGVKPLQNISFTLIAENPGTLVVPGGRARVEGLNISSNSVMIDVIQRGSAKDVEKPVIPVMNDAFYLAPGEDPQEKIRRNLFMKVQVDKKSCFVGEPVVATFKIYLRLESKSDIVKNPGFYGFTVQDMVNLSDNEIAVEVVNGKRFDVHTVRKVQLYPLQAGSFVIDPMEVENKVTFSRSVINKKTEHTVNEGVYDSDDASSENKSEEFENSMRTEPVTITVKPLPVKDQPSDFNGATGKFRILSSLKSPQLARNEEGVLKITISGHGNFTQMAPPIVTWPSGIEGFEPLLIDSLDQRKAPLEGSRTFQYRFVSAKSGSYVLPAAQFSFFDPDTNSYKTILSAALPVHIDEREKVAVDTAAYEKQIAGKILRVNPAYVWLSVIVFFVIAGAIWNRRKENRRIKEKELLEANRPREVKPVGEFLQTAFILHGGDDRSFFTALRQAVWDFFKNRFGLDGSKMNKRELVTVMQQQKTDDNLQRELLQILDQCEAGIFTDAVSEGDKKELYERTVVLLEKIDS